MKALLFIGLLILMFFHPAIALLILLFWVMGEMGRSENSGRSQPGQASNVVYQHEVVVRETIYASPTHYRPRRFQPDEIPAREQEIPARAQIPAEEIPAPQILAKPYRSQMYPWEMQDKLNRVNFSPLEEEEE
jgi:hypothetical protein